MLFPWQNCSFSTLKRPVSRMAGLLWTGNDILRRLVPYNLLHCCWVFTHRATLPDPATQKWQVANEYVLYNVPIHCWEASLRVTKSCIPAFVLPQTRVSLTRPCGDLGTLCSVCTRRYPCPEDRSGCPRPALSHTFLQSQTWSIFFESTIGSDC